MEAHSAIKPFRAWVANKYFYDMEQSTEEKFEFDRCTVFAISSYKGNQPTFQVHVTSNGAVFDYIPLQALKHQSVITDPMFKLYYSVCPDYMISVNEFPFLNGKIKAFENGKCYEGKYMFTVDWYKCNENAHMIELKNGQYCILPNHKLLFHTDRVDLPKYKKLHQEWV